MTSPLPPPWAAKVWVEGSLMHVDCPTAEGHLSHRLTFSCDANGMQRLQFMLKNRGAHSVIGTKGDLTQWQLDKFLTHKACPKQFEYDTKPGGVTVIKPKDSFTPSMRQAARDIMRRLGL